MRKSVPAGSFDGYLATLPEEVRVALERFRKITRAAAPDTTETISYRVPVFKLHGRPLVGFGAAKNHCSFFTMSSGMIPKLASISHLIRRGVRKYDFMAGNDHYKAAFGGERSSYLTIEFARPATRGSAYIALRRVDVGVRRWAHANLPERRIRLLRRGRSG